MDQDYHVLRSNIEQRVLLTAEDWERISSFFKPKFIKKKKDLFRADETHRHIAFVLKGCFRSFSTDLKGKEHTIQFALESYWIGDLMSFLTQQPSQYTIEAIEDSSVLLISKEKLDQLYHEVPIMERYFRILIETAYIATRQRLSGTMQEPAEVRYKKLLTKQPQFIQRIPLTYIASFLGITPESLSRIRKQLID